MRDIYALLRNTVAGLAVLVAATLVLGVAYPLTVTGVAAVAAPWQARGSLVTETGEHTNDPDEAVGSELVGQVTDDPRLFQPRASAAGDGYDMLATSGSNHGPESPQLLAAIAVRKAAIAARDDVPVGAIPADALTASGSGLDPHISPRYAALQAPRVARATGLTLEQVRTLVAEHTDGRTLGVLGEPRVNVLMLNISLLQATTG